ncbi:MAG: antibiotic biosynthesis monooxygenase family protein [Actinomycetota bacterium]
MIRSVLKMTPRPGRADDVVDLFRRAQVIERALGVEGCHDVSLLLSDDEILVTASWADADAYQAWIDHPERNAMGDDLNDLLVDPITAESVAGLYRVALAGSQAEGKA